MMTKTNRFSHWHWAGLLAVGALTLGAGSAWAGHLAAPLGKVTGADRASLAKHNRTGLVSLKLKRHLGVDTVLASVLVEADAAAVPAMLALGATVHSILPNGILTADVPVGALKQLAARADVGRIEPGKRVRLYNDRSNAFEEATGAGMNNPFFSEGANVIAGVMDSGLDWTHGDFIDDVTGESRILFYWDQSDYTDLHAPVAEGFTYGREYVKAEFDAALALHPDPWWAPEEFWFAPADDPAYPIGSTAGDWDGHGTHVTGTVAGDGSASGYPGVVPAAPIVFVKFDLEGERNTSAAIVDGVNYIFQKATLLGKPVSVNLSLGSDYGPHDGSSLEERSYDALVGPGKVVVAAAGNPGVNNSSRTLAWGYALHGTGVMGQDAITFRFDPYTPDPTGGSYVFFDLWYGGLDKCRVRITTPGGKVYPPSFSGSYKRTWVTGSGYTGFNTAEGGILVGNGGDQLGWETDNGDHELYIEISDYWGVAPAEGGWTIEIVPTSLGEGGRYHSWHGVSTDVVQGHRAMPWPRDPTPRFGGRETDNVMTIGSPASASSVIAAAAYSSRECWSYYDGKTDATSAGLQCYANAPIGYYDPYQIGELTYFSARGPRRDGVLKPEIATPGVGIASTLSHFTRYLEWADRALTYGTPGATYHFGTNRVLPADPADPYNPEGTILQGTSMASPNANGAVCLLLEARPSLDDDGLRALFAASARKDDLVLIYEHEPAPDGGASAKSDSDLAGGSPNNDWGHGKLDLTAALAELAPCTGPADCADGDPCTDDVCGGDGLCTNPPTGCGLTDGCCNAGCTWPTDADCPTCLPTGATCSTNSSCCSGSCNKKTKTCR